MHRPKLEPEAELVEQFIRLADHRGSDVRLSAGTPYRLAAWPREPIDSGLWAWRVFQSYPFRHEQHINVLETTAVFEASRQLLKQPHLHGKRQLCLVDSQVALGVLTKGRSSPRLLNNVLIRVGCFSCANLWPVFAWVASKLNPADGPSRWAAQQRGDRWQ